MEREPDQPRFVRHILALIVAVGVICWMVPELATATVVSAIWLGPLSSTSPRREAHWQRSPVRTFIGECAAYLLVMGAIVAVAYALVYGLFWLLRGLWNLLF